MRATMWGEARVDLRPTGVLLVVLRNRRRLMRALIAGLSAAGIVLCTPALAQEPSDDWDYAENAAGDVAPASVTFDALGIAVRCMNGSLSTIVSGLPAGTGERRLRVQLRDRVELDEPWVSARDSGTLFSVWPRQSAAAFSRGGRLSIRAQDGDRFKRYVVELPESPSAVAKVFAACGHDLAAMDVVDVLPPGEDLSGLVWVNRPEISFPSSPDYAFGLAALTCTVEASGRLRDCLVESEFPEGSGFGRAATLGAHRTGRVRAAEGSSRDVTAMPLSFTVRYRME